MATNSTNLPDRFIGPADIIKLYSGLREKTWCYNLYSDIRLFFKLTEPHQFPTLGELAQYLKRDVHQLARQLGWVK